MADLYELVQRYYDNKQEFDALKKVVDADNKDIKEVMCKSLVDNEAKFTANDIVATVKVIETEDFDNDKLVAKLKSIWSAEHGSMTNPWLKVVYQVDMEALQDAIYDNQIDPNDLKDCKVKKSQTRLTVRKVKKSETEN